MKAAQSNLHATHTDEQISVSLEKDTTLPVAWSVTPSNDPTAITTYDGNLTDNGGTIQINSAGAYDIAANVTDATGRVFAAPPVSSRSLPSYLQRKYRAVCAHGRKSLGDFGRREKRR